MTYTYTMKNRLEVVCDDKEILMAVTYDGDGSASDSSTGNGNATNAETNNSQNQCGKLDFLKPSSTGNMQKIFPEK